MATTMTRAQAAKLLSAPEMKLFEESRMHALRALSASQIDRRIARTRELRDRARDLLQRQRVSLQQKTGSRRGESGTADQQRSKDKTALMADILTRFESQLLRARKAEAAGELPANAPRKHATRKAAKTRQTAPDKDFTSARMASRKRDAEEAGAAMRARKTTAKAAKTTKAAKKVTTTKTAARKAATTTRASNASPDAHPIAPRLDGDTAGKRTRNLKALAAASNVQPGFPDARAHNTAQLRKFEAGRMTPIQAHISSRGRRTQGKRDGRG